MSAQMIVELSDGAKIHFGREPETGLSEVGAAEKIARASAEEFKAALGSLASLVAALEASRANATPAGQSRDGVRRLARRRLRSLDCLWGRQGGL